MSPEPSQQAPNPPMTQADARTLAAELAAVLGREQGDALLEKARALSMVQAATPGAQTSEFKLSVLGVCAGFAILVLGSMNGQTDLADRGLDLVQWSIAGYALARGITKAGAAKAK